MRLVTSPMHRIGEIWTRALNLPHLRALTSIGSISSVICLASIILMWRKLPPVVPLWYSRAWGEDQLANPWFLLFLPGASLMWQGVSLTLAGSWAEHQLFAKLLVVSSTLVSLLSLVTLVNILILVT